MTRLKIKMDGRWHTVEVGRWEGDTVQVLVDQEPVTVNLNAIDIPDAPVADAPVQAETPTPGGGQNPVNSPLPGMVLSIEVSVGQRVAAGEKLCVLEAMKMEQAILAPTAGVIRAIHVQKGQSLLIGEPIMELE